jgi:hypothetical protein
VAKAKKHRAATLSYVNREYGLSLNFPRNYQLKTELTTDPATKTGSETQLGSTATEPLLTNFVHPGGVILATVEMPYNSFPGTNFKSGFVNVRVNPSMTPEACAQFAVPALSMGADVSTPVKIKQLKVGATEFQEFENNADVTTKQADAKYYHAFNNGVCYEFALGIVTDGAAQGTVEEITAVDREVVFARLEKILATVKLRPAVKQETQAPAVAATTPADSSSTPAHEAAAPDF